MRTRSISRALATLVVLTLGVGVANAAADTPLYQGLETSLPTNWLSSAQLIEFRISSPDENFRSPLGSAITVDGQAANDLAIRNAVFDETYWAAIPSGTQIQITYDIQNRPIYRYPLGTVVAHRVRFQTADHPLFELRIVKKLTEGHWGFGLYAPDANGATLQLQQYAVAARKQYDLALSNGRTVKLGITPIPLGSCRNCHGASSSSAYQYGSFLEAGPCGFVPANGDAIRSWAADFRAQRGFDPIASP